jgi:hypothetical protein
MPLNITYIGSEGDNTHERYISLILQFPDLGDLPEVSSKVWVEMPH